MNLVTLKFAPKKKVYFEDMVESWLLYKKCVVKVSTYYNYRYLINKYLIPEFKRYSIDDFTNLNVNRMIERLLKRLSPKMIKDIMGVLKSILSYSEEKYRREFHIEPFAIPKSRNDDLEVLTHREQFRLEDYCFQEGSCRYLGIVFCLYTGMRIGELCALKWEDIDLKSRYVRINKTLQRIYIEKNKTKILIDTPKSAKSSRKIPLNDKLVTLLQEQKDKYPKSAYFLTGTTKYVEPRNYQHTFVCALKNSHIRRNYNFHILRHTFATNCIEVGMDPKSLSELLGHSTVNITLNRYVHSSDTIKKKYLQRL